MIGSRNMGKIVETKINRFDGGIVNDPRSPFNNVVRMATNFDILTDSYRIKPYRDSEDGDSAGSTSKKRNFCIALGASSTYRLYSLGVVSGAGFAEVLQKNLTTGASTDLDDNGWATPANNASASGASEFDLFVYYKKTGLIYGSKAAQYIWAFDPTGSAAFAETHRDLTSYSTTAQGLVHSKDDILYIPYDNKIAKNNNGSWTNAALTLPSHFYITSICEYGNYIAIACAPLQAGIANSRVYLWDRDSSLTTLSESVDWGDETIKILEQVGNRLVGISLSGATTTRFNDRIIFRYWNQGMANAEKFEEFIAGNNSSTLPIAKQKINNRLYFMMQVNLAGATREGVWSVGYSPSTRGFNIVHERTPNNDTALSSGVLYNFFSVGDYMFIAYLTSGAHDVSKTNDTSSFTATSIIETKIYNEGDSDLTKKLIGASVIFEPLPTAGQVVLKYKKDEESSFTTIYTYTTDNGISHGAINIESSGATLPEYKEIQFRIESTGGAVITGLKFKSEIIDKQLY